MNWLLPGFLAGALLVGLPVALHLLRRRPKETVRFPTLRFLGPSAVRDTNRHRLRRWLTLALRCLVLALLAAAFARPFWVDGQTARGRVMVVAIDNSFSMQAGQRLETLRRWALDQLHDLQPGDHAGLLLMHPPPTWLLPLTDDLDRVTATLIAARPGFEKTAYGPALRIGSEALAAHPAGDRSLVWMADEQRLGWLGVDLAQSLPPGVALRLPEPVSAPDSQAAIAAVERVGQTGAEELLVTIRLYEPGSQTRALTVHAGSTAVVERSVSLRRGENRIAIPLPPLRTDGLRIALDFDDLTADDTAWLAGGSAVGSAVRLDPVAEADALAHALRSTRRLGAGAMDPQPLPEGEWPADSVVILRGADTFRPPAVERLSRFADAGGPLWIFADGSPEQIAWLEARGIRVSARAAGGPPATLRDWDSEHPILAAFAGESLAPLLDVEFARGFNLAGDALAPIANWPDGRPALAAVNDRGRRLLVAGFSLSRDATDWSAQSSFVPFTHQTVRWLGSLGAARGDWRVGDTIPLPADGTWRPLEGPADPAQRAVGGSVRPGAPGLYEFTAGPLRRVFAVNVPPAESDLAPWPDAGQLAALASSAAAPANPVTAAAILPVSHEVAESRQRLWWWLLALCGLVLFAELALANRTSM